MNFTPRRIATGKIIRAWTTALTPEAMERPTTVADRDAGATRSRFSIPVSLSQTMVRP